MERCCWDKKQPGEYGQSQYDLVQGGLPTWARQDRARLSGWQQQRTLKTEQYVKPWKFLLKMAKRLYGHEWEHSEWKPKTTVERFKISQAKFWTRENSKTIMRKPERRRGRRISRKYESPQEVKRINMRVWSWLRMNAGGVPNTCKSSEAMLRKFTDGIKIDWAADGWVTRG